MLIKFSLFSVGIRLHLGCSCCLTRTLGKSNLCQCSTCLCCSTTSSHIRCSSILCVLSCCSSIVCILSWCTSCIFSSIIVLSSIKLLSSISLFSIQRKTTFLHLLLKNSYENCVMNHYQRLNKKKPKYIVSLFPLQRNYRVKSDLSYK